MTSKNVSRCLQVLARNKLLQEMHAFQYFNPKKKFSKHFSFRCGILPNQTHAERCQEMQVS